MSKLAKVTTRSFIISSCSGFLGGEYSDCQGLATNSNSGTIRSGFLAKRDTFITTSTSALGALMSLVLGTGSWTKVTAAVVQGVMVYVVTLRRTVFQDDLVHGDVAALCGARCIERFGETTPVGKPIPLVQPFIVSRINNGVLTTSKRNEAYTWVERLDNLVSIHGELHRRTSHAIMRRFSRIFIVPRMAHWNLERMVTSAYATA